MKDMNRVRNRYSLGSPYSFGTDGLTKLSGGSFGVVLANKDERIALKFFKILKRDLGYQQLMEMWACLNLNHPGVMGVQGCRNVYYELNDELNEIIPSLIQDDENLTVDDWFVVMDLADDTLGCRMRNRYIEMIFAQLLESVDYLHSVGIIHADIKPNNILVYKKKGRVEIKITDYSLSHFVHQKSRHKLLYAHPYRPPEFLHPPVDTSRSDEWALGCVMFEFVSGSRLFTFDEDKANEMHEYQIANYSSVTPEYFRNLMMSKMVSKYMARRLRFLLDSGLLDKISVILSSLISVSRKSCSEVLDMEILRRYWKDGDEIEGRMKLKDEGRMEMKLKDEERNYERLRKDNINISTISGTTYDINDISPSMRNEFIDSILYFIWDMDEYQILVNNLLNNIRTIKFDEEELMMENVDKVEVMLVMMFMLEKMLVKNNKIILNGILRMNLPNDHILVIERMILRCLDGKLVDGSWLEYGLNLNMFRGISSQLTTI